MESDQSKRSFLHYAFDVAVGPNVAHRFQRLQLIIADCVDAGLDAQVVGYLFAYLLVLGGNPLQVSLEHALDEVLILDNLTTHRHGGEVV